MLVEQRFVGRALVLTPTRNLTGGNETEELIAAGGQVLDQDVPRVVIDLSKIEWINSPGLIALVKIYISCVNRGGWMRVAGVGKRIKSMLVVTRLIRLFDTFDTVEEALAQPDAVKAEGGGEGRPSGSSNPQETSLKAALARELKTSSPPK
jgi:anti-sigma B factor antagonist